METAEGIIKVAPWHFVAGKGKCVLTCGFAFLSDIAVGLVFIIWAIPPLGHEQSWFVEMPGEALSNGRDKKKSC